MIVQKDRLIEILNLRRVGSKGWYSGDCPFCGKQDKFGVNFGEVPTERSFF